VSEAFQKAIEAVRLLLTWWFFVEPWEVAIRLRAGKNMSVKGPGVHLRIPFVDAVYIHNTRRMVTHCPSVTASSRDGRVYGIGVTVSFCIEDVVKLHTEVHDPESVVWQEMAQATAQFVSSRDSSEVMPDALKRELDRIDLSHLGLRDAQVCIGSFAAMRAYRIVNDGMALWSSEQHRVSTTKKV
jgi:hypothetical protein